jgi:acetylglutamate kinase
MRVIKIGGNEIDQPEFLEGLCAAVRVMERPLVLVHGGGKEIGEALQRYQIPSEFIAGVRATSEAAMPVVEQVLSGAVNKRIVARLNASGVAAIGISGVDLAMIETRPLQLEGRGLGRVGEITHVRSHVLRVLLGQGWLPVVSPVSLDATDRRAVNVNADSAALALAAALNAGELIFVSNVPGVLIDGAVVPQMDRAAVERGIAGGAITGGMIAKVRAATEALHAVPAVRITNLAGLSTGGTRIIAGEERTR